MSFPVFKALSASVAYVATHFFTLIKILWLPTLLLVAAMAYVMPGMMDAQMQMVAAEDAADPSAVFSVMGEMFKASGLIMLASAILYPMITAGVLKHVIRGQAPRLPFYLQFGADELRLLGAYILVMIIAIIAAVVGGFVFMAASLIVGIGLGEVSDAAAAIVIVLLALVATVVAIWFALRLSLVFPASIGARSLGIAQSWQITRGNTFGLFFYWLFWFILMLIVLIPISLLMASGYFSVFGDFIGEAIKNPDAAEQLGQEFDKRILDLQAQMWDRSNPGFWLNIASVYLYTMVNYGLVAVGGGVAYRYVTGSESND